AGPPGHLDDPDLHHLGATRPPGWEGVLHGRGGGGAEPAVDGRWGRPHRARRDQHRGSGGEEEEAVSDEPRAWVHPLRQRDLAPHARAEGAHERTHFADHGSEGWEASAADTGSRAPSGGRGRSEPPPECLRQLRDPAPARAVHRMGTRGPAHPPTGLQRYSSDLPDAGLRRRVHRTAYAPAAHHPARWAPAHLGPDSPVCRRLAWPMGGRYAGG